MAEYVAGADDGEEEETPETAEDAEQRAAESDAAAETVAKIVGGSKLYEDLFKNLQRGPILPQMQWIHRDLLGVAKVVADAQRSTAWVNKYAAGLRSMDQLAGTDRLQYLTATSAISDAVAGSGTVSAWRMSLQVESVLGDIIKGPVFNVSKPWATASFRRTLASSIHRQVYMTDWLAQIDTGRSLLSDLSSRPLAQYRDYVGGLGDTPTRFELDSSLHTGLGVNGLLGADVLSSGAVMDDPELEVEVADRVEDLLTPQQAGRLGALEDLRRVLARVDPKVVEMLEGGWANVQAAPPAAAEIVANCVVEAMDRAIRAAAPDKDVEQWLPSSGRPTKEWRSENGRLTRSVRIRYIMRGHKDEARMTCTMADNLISLQKDTTQRAQAIKHASAGDVAMARSLLTVAEHILTLLFVVQDR